MTASIDCCHVEKPTTLSSDIASSDPRACPTYMRMVCCSPQQLLVAESISSQSDFSALPHFERRSLSLENLREFASSPNGDRWFLGMDDISHTECVLHRGNQSSGGYETVMPLAVFLDRRPLGPEHSALEMLLADRHSDVDLATYEGAKASAEFQDIKIVALNDGASGLSDHGPLTSMVLALSADAPREWSDMFNKTWEINVGTMRRKATAAGDTITSICMPYELQGQISQFNEVIAETNIAYKEKVSQEEIARHREAREALRDLKHSLKYE